MYLKNALTLNICFTNYHSFNNCSPPNLRFLTTPEVLYFLPKHLL
jgi:hypothetical protein